MTVLQKVALHEQKIISTVRRYIMVTILAAAFTFSLFSSAVFCADTSSLVKETTTSQLTALRSISLPFIANEGQMAEEVKFSAQTFAGGVAVTKEGEIVYTLGRKSKPSHSRGDNALPKAFGTPPSSLAIPPHPASPSFAKRGLVGVMVPEVRGPSESPAPPVTIKEILSGSKTAKITGSDKTETIFNSYIGNDPAKWKKGIASYKTIEMGEVYEKISLSLRAYGSNVEKIFRVKPAGKPEDIKIEVKGSEGISINAKGELEIKTSQGPVALTKPVAYQDVEGKKVEVEAAYKIIETGEKQTYAFALANYDKTKDLIIDPLIASTFVGGSGDDTITALVLSEDGASVYATGRTSSVEYTPGLPQNYYLMIVKFDAMLTTLQALTVIGAAGPYYESISMAYHGPTNAVFITGVTENADFPFINGFQKKMLGWPDIFIARLNADSLALEASTFLGADPTAKVLVNGKWKDPIWPFLADYASSIAADANGYIYVSGYTANANFPVTPGAYKTTCGTDGQCNATFSSGKAVDVFIAKISNDLSVLAASTFLGGKGQNYAMDIAINHATGDVYVAGDTNDNNFPVTAGAFDTTCGTDSDCNSTGRRPCDSYTDNLCNRFQFDDPECRVHVSCGCGGGLLLKDGRTCGTPSRSGFISRFSNDLSSLLSSTYLGGSGNINGIDSVIVAKNGAVYVSGETNSADFPTTEGAFSRALGASSGGYGFISRFNKDLTSLEASTLGAGYNLAEGRDGTIYTAVGGMTMDSWITPSSLDQALAISRLDANLNTLLSSALIPRDYVLAISPNGRIYFAGAAPADLPVTAGSYSETMKGPSDGFIAILDPDLSSDWRHMGSPAENPFTSFDGGNGPGRMEALGLPNYWVNTSNLNLVVQNTDFASGGLGPSVAMTRTWNSGAEVYLLNVPKGMFGNGWSSSLEESVKDSGMSYIGICKDNACDYGIFAKATNGAGHSVPYFSKDNRLTFSAYFPSDLDTLKYCPGPPLPVQANSLCYYSADTLTHWELEAKGSRQTYRYDCPINNKTKDNYCLGAKLPLTSITDPNGNKVTLTFSPWTFGSELPTIPVAGTLQKVTDASGRETAFEYNSDRLCTKMTTPDAKTASYTYDSKGNLIKSTSLSGTVTTYAYDARNFMTSMTVGDKVTSFTWQDTPDGRKLESVTDAKGKTRKYTITRVAE